jgi:nitroreductase
MKPKPGCFEAPEIFGRQFDQNQKRALHVDGLCVAEIPPISNVERFAHKHFVGTHCSVAITRLRSHNRSKCKKPSSWHAPACDKRSLNPLTRGVSVTDTIEFLKKRRSVKPREMSGPGPSPAELETILTIGSRVPDHGKLAPWRFIVFEGDARARAGDIIARVFARKHPDAHVGDIEIEKRRLMEAPLVIGVISFIKPHPKVPAWEQELSAGASCMNIVSAATALGYGANWLTGWFAFDRDVLDGLGLAPDEKIAGFIHVGSVSQPNEDRPRPTLADLVTRF